MTWEEDREEGDEVWLQPVADAERTVRQRTMDIIFLKGCFFKISPYLIQIVLGLVKHMKKI